MKNLILRRTLALFSVLLAISISHAGIAPSRERLTNYDRRSVEVAAAATPEQQAGVEALRTELPTAKVEFDPLIHAPKVISVSDGFLTGPGGQGKGISAGIAARFAG